MHDLFQIYLNTICSRIEVEHFAKRVKPVKFCLVSDYPVFGVTEVFFLEIPFMQRSTGHFRVGDLLTRIIRYDLGNL